MQILITGAGGMLGKALSKSLSAVGHAIIPVSLTKATGLLQQFTQ
ncbi:MAG: hypothetical protein R3E79_05440 [Caldilineaceae bacterium]